MPQNLLLVTEDILSETIGRLLLQHVSSDDLHINCIGRRGINYIKEKMKNLNKAAAELKIVVIVDRDLPKNCPVEMARKWTGTNPNPNLSIRFAEMEIESWILADNEKLAAFLNVPLNRITFTPDTVLDPKREIVKAARHSRSRQIRDELCPAPGATAVVGPAYNSNLEYFLHNHWRPDIAAINSPSLKRAEKALKLLISK